MKGVLSGLVHRDWFDDINRKLCETQRELESAQRQFKAVSERCNRLERQLESATNPEKRWRTGPVAWAISQPIGVCEGEGCEHGCRACS